MIDQCLFYLSISNFFKRFRGRPASWAPPCHIRIQETAATDLTKLPAAAWLKCMKKMVPVLRPLKTLTSIFLNALSVNQTRERHEWCNLYRSANMWPRRLDNVVFLSCWARTDSIRMYSVAGRGCLWSTNLWHGLREQEPRGGDRWGADGNQSDCTMTSVTQYTPNAEVPIKKDSPTIFSSCNLQPIVDLEINL